MGRAPLIQFPSPRKNAPRNPRCPLPIQLSHKKTEKRKIWSPIPKRPEQIQKRKVGSRRAAPPRPSTWCAPARGHPPQTRPPSSPPWNGTSGSPTKGP